MGVKNFLIEGVSCTGKTSVGHELERRGYHCIHGDDELAYWGDARTGEPVESTAYEHWIWDVEKVRAVVADHTHEASFFCGGSRNSDQFVGLLDGVFVLEIDLETLNRRLALRPDDEWGGPASDGAANARIQHAAQEEIPEHAISIDATGPLVDVVDAILGNTDLAAPQLEAITEMAERFDNAGVDYWLFGGWAVDFHAGRVSRRHDDIDFVVWERDHDVVVGLLSEAGFEPQPSKLGFRRSDLTFELTLIKVLEDGLIVTPGFESWPWATNAVGDERRSLGGGTVRVVSAQALLAVKSEWLVEMGDEPRPSDIHDIAVLGTLGLEP